MNESDLCSNEHCLSSSEKKAWSGSSSLSLLLSSKPERYYCKCLCDVSILIYIVILITVFTVVVNKHLVLNYLSITTEISSFLIE